MRHTDGLLMVMRARHCQREAIVDALAALTLAGGRLLGSVLFGTRQPFGQLTAYYNGYGYGYSTAGRGQAEKGRWYSRTH